MKVQNYLFLTTGWCIDMGVEYTAVQQYIANECDSIKEMLLEKNKTYGNSAAEPINIFSKKNPIDAIDIRIDDKLKRIRDGNEFKNEDTLLDLIGYLILRRVTLALLSKQKVDYE